MLGRLTGQYDWIVHSRCCTVTSCNFQTGVCRSLLLSNMQMCYSRWKYKAKTNQKQSFKMIVFALYFLLQWQTCMFDKSKLIHVVNSLLYSILLDLYQSRYNSIPLVGLWGIWADQFNKMLIRTRFFCTNVPSYS